MGVVGPGVRAFDGGHVRYGFRGPHRPWEAEW